MALSVVVRFHRRAAPGLAHWMHTLIGLADLRQMYYRATIEELRRRFIALRGEIDEAHIAGEGEQRAWWWEFVPGFWVGYRWRERGFWLWKRREVLVISIAERPPGPAA
jgi:hypothetical protein